LLSGLIINYLLLIFSLHKELLKDFFCNARYLLMPYGEIHVRHKTGGPYDRWDLEQLASDSCLIMFEKENFQIADYPGYNQKRGNGARCDQPFNLGLSCTFKFVMGDLKKRKKLSGNQACSTSSLGMSNVHPPGNLETDSRPFHPLPLLQAWPWLHFTPTVNTVRMPIPPQPMSNIAAPLLNALPAPGIIPPQVSRIAFHNFLALLNQPYYQQRSVAGPPPLGGSLQRGCEAMMPGAAGLSYSSAFLEQCYRESVQRQEGLRAMMPGAAGLSYSSAFLEQCYKESVQRQEGLRAVESASAALSYSSAFLEQCYRESVQRQERLNRMITYGCQ
jgi:25S rRNA (uracil2634-N3)-methyltransferase